MTSVTSENDTSSKSGSYDSELATLPRNTVLKELTLVSNLNNDLSKLSTIPEGSDPNLVATDFKLNGYRSGLISQSTSYHEAARLCPSDLRARTKQNANRNGVMFRAGFLDRVSDSVRFVKDPSMLHDNFRTVFAHHISPDRSRKLDHEFSMKVDQSDVLMFHPSAWGFPELGKMLEGWYASAGDSKILQRLSVFGYSSCVYSVPKSSIEAIAHGKVPDWLQCSLKADLKNIPSIADTDQARLLAAGLLHAREVYVQLGEGNSLATPDSLFREEQTGKIHGINALRLALQHKGLLLPTQVRQVMFQLGCEADYEWYWFGVFVLNYPLPPDWAGVVANGIFRYSNFGSWQSIHPQILEFKSMLLNFRKNLFLYPGAVQVNCAECGELEANIFCANCMDDFCPSCFARVHVNTHHFSRPIAGTKGAATSCSSEWVSLGKCYYNFRLKIWSEEISSITAANDRKWKSAISIQSLFRSFSVRLGISRRRAAAVVIQSFVRMQNAKIVVGLKLGLVRAKAEKAWLAERSRKMNEGEICVLKLQAMFRQQKERQNFLQKKSASISIQSFWRGIFAREKCALKREFILRIQKWIRSVLSRIWMTRKFFCATLIQARYRGISVRTGLKNLRESVVILQALFRGQLTRKKMSVREKSAVLIQSFWRRKMAVVSVLGILKNKIIKRSAQYVKQLRAQLEYVAARGIQKIWRSKLARNEFSKTKLERENAEKGAYRAVFFLAFTELDREDHSWGKCDETVKPESLLAGFRDSKWIQHGLMHWMSKILNGKFFHKTYFGNFFPSLSPDQRKSVLTLFVLTVFRLEFDQPALTLESNLGFQGMDNVLADRIGKQMTQQLGVKHFKHSLGKQSRPHDWVSWLLRCGEPLLPPPDSKKMDIFTILKMVKNCLKNTSIPPNGPTDFVHQVVHTHSVLRALCLAEVRNRAANLIGYHFRKHLQLKQRKVIVPSCILIQKIWRGRSVRKRISRIMRSVRVIQRNLKICMWQIRNEKLKSACVCIQAFVRGFQARKLLLKRAKAALTIQRMWRGFLVRLLLPFHSEGSLEDQKRRNLDRKKRVAKIQWGKAPKKKPLRILQRRNCEYLSDFLVQCANVLIALHAHKPLAELVKLVPPATPYSILKSCLSDSQIKGFAEKRNLCFPLENCEPVTRVLKKVFARYPDSKMEVCSLLLSRASPIDIEFPLTSKLDPFPVNVESDWSDPSPIDRQFGPYPVNVESGLSFPTSVESPTKSGADTVACVKLVFISCYLVWQKKIMIRMFSVLIGILNRIILVFDLLLLREPIYRVELQSVSSFPPKKVLPVVAKKSSVIVKTAAQKAAPVVFPNCEKYMTQYMKINGGDDSLFRDISDHDIKASSGGTLEWVPIKASKFGLVRAQFVASLRSDKQRQVFAECESRGEFCRCVNMLGMSDAADALMGENFYHLIIGYLAHKSCSVDLVDKAVNSLDKLSGDSRHILAIRGMVLDACIGWEWHHLTERHRVADWFAQCEAIYGALGHKNRSWKCQIRFGCVLAKQGLFSESISVFKTVVQTGQGNWAVIAQINAAIVAAMCRGPPGKRDGVIEKMKKNIAK